MPGRLTPAGSDRRPTSAGCAGSESLQHWASGQIYGADSEAVRRFAREADPLAVLDRFGRSLPFGTGGRRGVVGLGPNRMNQATVALTVQGHCDFLREAGGRADLSVVVANDVRVFTDMAGAYRFMSRPPALIGLSSRSFAWLAARVYAANGIRAYLSRPDDPLATLTTPELSFAIRRLQAHGGVNISASHNHPDDNGIKIYDGHGGQFPPAADSRLTDVMGTVTCVSLVACGASCAITCRWWVHIAGLGRRNQSRWSRLGSSGQNNRPRGAARRTVVSTSGPTPRSRSVHLPFGIP